MKKFKYNWGWGILFSIIVFLLIMIGIIIFSMNRQVDLVTKDYYQKEIRFQTQIDKENKKNLLNKKVDVFVERENVLITFSDSSNITGELHFYRPSNYKMDFIIQVVLSKGNKMLIVKDKFKKGFWRLKINWNQNGQDFYSEKSFMIQ